ncbi:hypothetical protein H8M03_05585 [Sphingomonas sabuli]|uniref:Uncharacterized protein n=1 Tax=Sphingomonas sabuli TaxID=2764186 RepID=A0A7G9L593_9SPHN|nr:hypothetical protein [Sphingomonas sabuli]QNM83792.1 hypothetical protein H8M03_05585 [Sphingomonas sabuli]
MRNANRGLKRSAKRAGRSLSRLVSSPAKRRRSEVLDMVRESPLFDQRWYLERYPDVLRAGIDPVSHFLEAGWLEGRDPGPSFSTTAYLKGNADVARSGINPLIHFIEFGQSEGREVRSHNPSLRRLAAVTYKFGPPAQVFRGAVPAQNPQFWLQSHRLDADDPSLVRAGGWPVGYAQGAEVRDSVELAFGRLAALSGFAPPEAAALDDWPEDGHGRLRDAWFANRGQLRTRWSGCDFPVVVRAYQHDQLDAGGALLPVAEQLLESPLDYVDCSVGDAFFPILFVFSDASGAIRGTTLLAIPSFCRGGLHYAELIAEADSAGSAPDPVAAGREHMLRLAGVRGEGRRIAAVVTVDLGGADGTSPMFQREFRGWLNRVAGVSVVARGDGPGVVALRRAGEVAEDDGETRSLLIGADMIPTVGILSALGAAGSAKDVYAPLLITKPDASQPILLADIGRSGPAVLGATTQSNPLPWPRMREPSARGVPTVAAAIRLGAGRTLTDAELLVPASADLPIPETREATSITWLLAAEGWPAAELLEAARSLTLQAASCDHELAIVGTVTDETLAALTEILGRRTRTFGDFAGAVQQASGDYIGYLGRGVILHDLRTVDLMLAMLDDPAVTSASCPLVTSERRGKSWHLSLADAGSAVHQSDGTIAALGVPALDLWRTFYPVALPPHDFWLARAEGVEAWMRENAVSTEGVHVCAALVTATTAGAGRKTTQSPAVPAYPDAAIRTRVLYG